MPVSDDKYLFFCSCITWCYNFIVWCNACDVHVCQNMHLGTDNWTLLYSSLKIRLCCGISAGSGNWTLIRVLYILSQSLSDIMQIFVCDKYEFMALHHRFYLFKNWPLHVGIWKPLWQRSPTSFTHQCLEIQKWYMANTDPKAKTFLVLKQLIIL